MGNVRMSVPRMSRAPMSGHLSLTANLEEKLVCSAITLERVSMRSIKASPTDGYPQRSALHTSLAIPRAILVITMSQPKTTWEDLARLGWPIYDVYKKANASRGGTMNGIGDIFLNSGIAAEYQCVYLPLASASYELTVVDFA